MDVCKSDIENIIRLLEKSADLINKYCPKPCEQDKARQCRKLINKLKKLEHYESNNQQAN